MQGFTRVMSNELKKIAQESCVHCGADVNLIGRYVELTGGCVVCESFFEYLNESDFISVVAFEKALVVWNTRAEKKKPDYSIKAQIYAFSNKENPATWNTQSYTIVHRDDIVISTLKDVQGRNND